MNVIDSLKTAHHYRKILSLLQVCVLFLLSDNVAQ